MSSDHAVSESDRLALAYQCLRKLWQIQDAGGISCGRSAESVYVEAAINLIGRDSKYSEMADRDGQQFLQLVRDTMHDMQKAEIRQHDQQNGIDVDSPDYVLNRL
jgi:hypothetical protein